MTTILMNEACDDIDFSQHKLVLVSGLQEIKQKIMVRLRFVKGEWFLNEKEGFPFLDVLGSKEVPERLSDLFRQVIESVPGVLEILAFDTVLQDRELQVTFRVRCEDGVIAVTDAPFIIA